GADRAAALDALQRVGLAHRARDRFGVLSGGQRQRVLLARAIAQEAELLLLDEPFNGLDTTTSDLLLEVLAQLRADGVAVVMSTHDLAVAHLACDHACLLNHHQVAFGPIRESLTPDLLGRTYGGSAVVVVSHRSGFQSDLTALLFGRILDVDNRQIVETAVAGTIAITVLAALHKELLLRALDPVQAEAVGYRIAALDLVLDVITALV